MIIDVVSYNGEEKMFDLRYNILKDKVDKFIVVEATTTFTGKPKQLYFDRIKDKYPDVEYFVIDENYTIDEVTQAKRSPNTIGEDHWKHEFLQKESIKKALVNLNDEDVVFIGDVDEIYEPYIPCGVDKLKLRVYTYYLNNRSNEEFWGTIGGKWKYIKDKCLNHLRCDIKNRTEEYLGWHFTSMGGYEEVKRKLEDSYSEKDYFNPIVQSMLQNRIERRIDFLGRDFKYIIDESEWPDYLKDNKDKYIDLCVK